MEKVVNWLKNNIGYLFVIIFVIWIAYGIIMFIAFGKEAIKNAGTFGDMFGAINALFTGLALVGVIVSNIYQREELKLQRIELRESRKELKRNADEITEQRKNMQLQRFETTFFNLISMYKTNIEKLKDFTKHDVDTGIDLLNRVVIDVSNKNYPHANPLNIAGSQIVSIIPELSNICDDVLFILTFIENQFEEEKDREFYSKIFVSQMSQSERYSLTAIVEAEKMRDKDNDRLLKKYGIYIEAP
ncbi:hypothetical protein [Paenibacillus camelliae]|uniref:hypothetical protein n=1 Tax=Paenibacillus camelliae TaxID=512410 RepID=UPI00203C0BF0|nr:hypothetical protein [Paenibacillus camelliae]MCM3632949.1 hypothetical protein [Paenibacillus camelliae]